MRYLDKLSEAKKRFYTKDEIDAYARGREKATMARRKKEFEDFYSDPKKKKKKAKLEEAKKKRGRCWTGYKPKPGSVPYSKGSCIKEGYKLLGLALIEAIERKELNYKDETARAIAADKKLKAATKEHDSLPKGESEEKALLQKRRERALKVKQGRLKRAADKMESIQSHMSYQQIGDILAESVFGKIRSKVADKLDKFSRDQYRKGEVDDASGKPKRARLRGRVAHFVGKAAQKVRPEDKA